MALSKLRQAIGAVKDQTSIGLAMVGNSASISDLEVAIVKATRHEEYPPAERYVREILSLTTYSRAFVSACVGIIARRLNKTKNWVVALKAIMLIQRLLADGDVVYEQEIFFTTRLGTRLLNLSDFRDTSGKSCAWDFSAFVRMYALYLDEQLELKMQGRRGKRSPCRYQLDDEENTGSPNDSPEQGKPTALYEVKTEKLFTKVHCLLQLLDRFLACMPTGAARDHGLVIVALFPIVKESFLLYYDITEILGVFLDRFPDLDPSHMVQVHDIFSRAAKQFGKLDAFYAWTKAVGISHSSEYPDVEKISQKKLDMMDEYVREKSISDQITSPELELELELDLDSEPESESEPEEDMNAIKALPPPDEKVLEEPNKEMMEIVEVPKKAQDEGDLLNLSEDAPTPEEHRDKLALALFDSAKAGTVPGGVLAPWEAIKEADWETALVQSMSYLSNQKAFLPGGLNASNLDGMYQQGAATAQAAIASGVLASGSASSVALGCAGRPSIMALPAPPTGSSVATDPFAASLTTAPPWYVQMSDMEKKRRLLMEEQLMWQQYERDGMKGQISLRQVQHNPYYYA